MHVVHNSKTAASVGEGGVFEAGLPVFGSRGRHSLGELTQGCLSSVVKFAVAATKLRRRSMQRGFTLSQQVALSGALRIDFWMCGITFFVGYHWTTAGERTA